MLGNNEKIEGLDKKETFIAMLRELPWDALKAFVQANSQINKLCTVGGHRVDKKRRKRFEKVICREAEKKDFSTDITSGIFAQWYPAQEDLHQALEKYFESDEYASYRQENQLDDDEYALPDDKFENLFDARDIQKWRILLCFSPLKFTTEQADRIMQEAGSSPEALQQVYDVQAEIDNERKEKNRLTNENNDLRKRIDELSSEDQDLRNERKELRAERDSLQNKFAVAQNENQRLREEVEGFKAKSQQIKQAVSKDIERDKKRLIADLEQVKKELVSWKEKYEKQRSDNRQRQDELKTAEKALASERTAAMAQQKEVRKLESFADAVLERIDWREVGRQMKLTPQLKRKFNSLMRSLQYEDDRSITLGDTLDKFWNSLQRQENELLQAMARSDTREVQKGEIGEYWNSLTDNFEDVSIGLEARTILLQILREIFYQTLSMEDLEQAAAPGAAKDRKKADKGTASKARKSTAGKTAAAVSS